MLRLLLPLNVTTTREGWLRLTSFFAVMCIMMLTAILCVLYEVRTLQSAPCTLASIPKNLSHSPLKHTYLG
jgi:hypothetical protein